MLFVRGDGVILVGDLCNLFLPPFDIIGRFLHLLGHDTGLRHVGALDFGTTGPA